MTVEEKAVHPYNDTTGRWERIAEADAGGWEWAIAVVFRDKTTGRLYGDTDAGCSCYGPWEIGYTGDDYNGIDDLKEITSQRDAAALLDDVHGEDGPVSTTDRQDFVRKVAVALAEGGTRVTRKGKLAGKDGES